MVKIKYRHIPVRSIIPDSNCPASRQFNTAMTKPPPTVFHTLTQGWTTTLIVGTYVPDFVAVDEFLTPEGLTPFSGCVIPGKSHRAYLTTLRVVAHP